MSRCRSIALVLALWTTGVVAQDSASLRALIVDGQNNHGNWPTTTQMMKSYLEQTGLFSVTIARTAAEGTDGEFRPKFADFDVVVSNYNGAPWPEATQREFESFVENGGGFVVIHAANNAFPEWPAYNRMIGLGGWGNRNEKSGPLVYFDAQGKMVRDESPKAGGNHGPQHEFAVTIRDPDHPITSGMPGQWKHANDELYDSLRGPAEQMKVLATAFSASNQGGTDRHEPMMMVIEFGKGRIFHTPMGHGNDSQECAGFIVTFQRGAEWAATGKVTQSIPDDFPTEEKTSTRKFVESSSK